MANRFLTREEFKRDCMTMYSDALAREYMAELISMGWQFVPHLIRV